MFEIPHDAVVPLEKFSMYFSEDPCVYLDLEMVKKEISSIEHKLWSRLKQLREMMYASLGYIPPEITKYVVLEYFDAHGVPFKYTKKRGTEDTVTLAKKALSKMVYDGYCVDFCLLYMDKGSVSYYLSKVKALLNSVRDNRTVEGNNGETLTVVPYTVTATFNRRFSTANENVIGFYGTLKKAMKAPKGYVLVGGDFPQIDGKGAMYLYLKTQRMLNIARNTTDTYLVAKEMVRHHQNTKNENTLKKALASKEFVDTVDLEKQISSFNRSVLPFTNKGQRDLYKVVFLRTVYNSRSSPFGSTDYAIKRLATMLEVTGRYRVIKEHALLFREIGYPIIAQSRWGYKRSINETSEFDTLAKLFNSPIQATSSDIIIMFVVAILSKMREEDGLTKDDVKLYLNRHDEPHLLMKVEYFYQYAQFLKEMSHILVHGWLPFEMKWEVGPNYMESLPEYEQYLEQCPYDMREIQRVAEAHLDDPEPMTMEIPIIFALSYRHLPNGKIMFLLTRYLGEFPTDTYYLDQYRDDRRLEYTLLSLKTDIAVFSLDHLLTMIEKFLKGMPKSQQYIVALDQRELGSKPCSINEYSVYVTDAKLPLHDINKVVFASVFVKNFPEVATAEDRNFNRYSQYYSKLMDRRVL